jgi:hypothetical protein
MGNICDFKEGPYNYENPMVIDHSHSWNAIFIYINDQLLSFGPYYLGPNGTPLAICSLLGYLLLQPCPNRKTKRERTQRRRERKGLANGYK